MLHVAPLVEEEIITLEEMRKKHTTTATNMRAHAIILSNQGRHVAEIADILGVCRQSVSTWFKAWENRGLLGLVAKNRPGRPRKLSLEQEQKILNTIKEEPGDLKNIAAKISKEMDISISVRALRKLCK